MTTLGQKTKNQRKTKIKKNPKKSPKSKNFFGYHVVVIGFFR